MRIHRQLVPLFLAFSAISAPSVAPAQIAVGLSITLAPPPLPVYVQPPLPAPGYIWTPGYWAYGPAGYYWVPGTWVLPPAVGLLWTPGYWGWVNGIYSWHAGYWGPHVGFYGGINYGFGYTGVGFFGGHWDHGVFVYNNAVTHVTINNVATFNRPVAVAAVSRVSFNGGNGGIHAQPTAAQIAAARERHFGATPLQAQHEHAAAGNHALLATVNHNRPPIAATARPGEFNGPGVVHAGGPRPQGERAAARPEGRPERPAAQHEQRDRGERHEGQ